MNYLIRIKWKKIHGSIMNLIVYPALCYSLFFIISTKYCHATNTNNATNKKLLELDVKIKNLKRSLVDSKDKKNTLNKELAKTDKAIGRDLLKLRSMERELNEQRTNIEALEHQILALNEQLKLQHHYLAEHVRAHHRMGENQPLKWLFSQDTLFATNRLLTYYQYLIQSRETIINRIKETKQQLFFKQKILHRALTEQQRLQATLKARQSKLNHAVTYQKQLIKALNHNIQNTEQKIQEFQRNKNQLTSLLNRLSKHNDTNINAPFSKLKHKLPRPIVSNQKSASLVKQGVLFVADEGTPVRAIYPGKIVFSDWLRGYGLLLIIDHGQGYMTLYAHNQSLLKKQGDLANQGEQIATVGHSGGLSQNGLYFEVRQRGKAIPPMEWVS